MSFYAQSPVALAKALLGMNLVHVNHMQLLMGRIVETEAYLGPHDFACHSAKGRTPRTEVMFGPPGHAYVYLVYGLHLCVNVVTGDGAAVLIRALEPGLGLEGKRTDGPGRLTRALGLSRDANGLQLSQPPLYLTAGAAVPASSRGTSARIGVDYAGKWADRPLRFFDRNSRWVSRSG